MLTLSDRLRPPGIGFGVGWIHVYPASIYGDAARARPSGSPSQAVHALGLRERDRVPAADRDADGGVLVVEVAARIPGGQMADLVRHAVGVDLVEVALRQALGEPVPDELALPQFQQPLAIRFLTAEPGPLPTGTVVGDRRARAGARRRRASCRRTRTSQVGETIRPVRARRRPARLRDRGRGHDPRGARPGRGGRAPARRWRSRP